MWRNAGAKAGVLFPRRGEVFCEAQRVPGPRCNRFPNGRFVRQTLQVTSATRKPPTSEPKMNCLAILQGVSVGPLSDSPKCPHVQTPPFLCPCRNHPPLPPCWNFRPASFLPQFPCFQPNFPENPSKEESKYNVSPHACLRPLFPLRTF